MAPVERVAEREQGRDPFTGVQIRIGVMGCTRGRHLQEGAKSVRIFGDEVPVRARVETIHGLSAHAAADGLLRWLGTAARPPERVFLVHGDPGPAATLAGRIRKELGWRATVPAYRDRAPLGDGDAP